MNNIMENNFNSLREIGNTLITEENQKVVLLNF